MEKIFKFSCAAKPKILGLVSFLLVTALTVESRAATSSNNYPYAETFEGIAANTHLNDQNGWYSPVSSTAVVTGLVSHAGSRSLYVMPMALVSNLLYGTKSTNLWVNFWTKPATRADPAPPAFDPACSAQFYVNSSSNLVAYDAVLGWRVLSNNAAGFSAAKINPANFNRITMFMYHADNTWAMLVNDELLADRIKMTNANGYIGLNGFSISNNAYIDTITVETNTPLDLAGDVDVDGMPDVWELAFFRSVASQGWSSDYDSDGRTSVEEYQDVTDPTNPADSRWRLPYLQTFEQAPITTITSWRALVGTGDTRVQTAVALQGARSASVVTGRLSLAITDTTATNVWIHVVSKPNPVTSLADAPPATVSCGFCVVSNVGDLYAYSGTAWQKMNLIPNVPTNQLLGFAVHVDYIARTWNLYVSTNSVYGPVLNLANSTLMDVNSLYGSGYFTGFTITNDSTNAVYVDMLAASHAFTNQVLAVHSNVYAAERLANTTYTVRKPPYDYVGTNAALGYKLGVDLATSLYAGDEVSVLYTNGWNEYYLNAGAWNARVGSMNPTNMYVSETTGISMHRLPGSDLMVFYPYFAVSDPTNVLVYGTVAATNGWNLLVWPGLSPRAVNASPGIGFTAPAAADMIFIYQNYQYKKLYRNSGQWYQDGSPSTMILSPNQGFWYRNSSAADVWWYVGDVTP